MKKSVIFPIVIIVSLLFVTSIQAQNRTVVWERWDVIIDRIETAQNRFVVQEIYDVNFSGTFRFGSRIIPREGLNNITDIQIFENGTPLEVGCGETSGTYCVRDTVDGKSITYYFRQAITNGSQNFRIQYTVEGALRSYVEGDQLWWIAIPEDHFGFPIRASRIVVQMPNGYSPRAEVDPVATYGVDSEMFVCDQVSSCSIPITDLSQFIETTPGDMIVAQATSQLGGSDSLEIRVQYPHNPDMIAPIWQENFDDRRAFEENIKPIIDIGSVVISMVIGLAGSLGVFTLYQRRGRDPKIGPVPEYLSEPPSDLTPSVVGSLVDEKVDLPDILAGIVDLAHRGYLVIEEDQTGGIFGIGKSSEFTFKRTDKSNDGASKFERKLLSVIFGGSKERELDDLKNKFYKHLAGLQKALYEEMVDHGYFIRSPESIRNRWRLFGGGLLGLGVLTSFVTIRVAIDFSAALVCIPASLAVVGGILLILGQFMPAKTQLGAEEAAKWLAFRKYMERLEGMKDLEGAVEKFDKYLPYAIVFGMERSWIKRFSKIETMQIPPWYYPRHFGGPYSGGYRAGTPFPQGMPAGSSFPGDLARAGGGGLDGMSGNISHGLNSISDGLTNMLESSSQVFKSQPQSSGGGGWSGGGSFGGGGSGGGSSGFG